MALINKWIRVLSAIDARPDSLLQASKPVWCAVRSHPNMTEGDSSDMDVTHMVRQEWVHRSFMG